MRTTATPEGKVKTNIKRALKARSLFHFSPVMGLGRAGIPDIIVCWAGKFVGIEVKADAKKSPTPLQIQAARDIAASGGIVLLLHAGNWSEFASRALASPSPNGLEEFALLTSVGEDRV